MVHLGAVVTQVKEESRPGGHRVSPAQGHGGVLGGGCEDKLEISSTHLDRIEHLGQLGVLFAYQLPLPSICNLETISQCFPIVSPSTLTPPCRGRVCAS